MIDLLALAQGFDATEDFETDAAYFRTQTSWRSPGSYLHVIYKPLPASLLGPPLRRLAAPPPEYDLLESYNGARLFAGAFSVFGVWKPGQLLGEELWDLPTFDLEMMNRETDQALGLAIGCYGDSALVFLDRYTEEVACWFKGEIVFRWDTVGQWLTSECARLSTHFDERGCLLQGESKPASPPARRRVQ